MLCNSMIELLKYKETIIDVWEKAWNSEEMVSVSTKNTYNCYVGLFHTQNIPW